MVEDLGKLILRLTVGVLLLFHGVAKLFHGIDPIRGMVVSAGLPSEVAYGVYLGEVIAPLMVALGLFTRLGAVLIVINMVFAVLLAHTGDFLAFTDHGGWRLELQGFFLFTALAVALLGSGRYALRPDD